jgi:hypothetical protein
MLRDTAARNLQQIMSMILKARIYIVPPRGFTMYDQLESFTPWTPVRI